MLGIPAGRFPGIRRDRLAGALLAVGPAIVLLVALALVAAVVVDGAGQLDRSLLVEDPEDAGRAGGLAPMLASTAWVLAIGIGSALPPGLAAATWLAEYGVGRLPFVRGALDLLSAVPSVVFGLFGLAFFCEQLGLGWSVLAGGLTVGIMIFPLFVRLGEAGLRAVPDHYRSAGHALGLARWQLIARVLLPEAAPALAAALVLATGRVLAESAVFLFTAGASTHTPLGPLDPGRVLAVHVYLMAIEVPGGGPRAMATALVLLLAILATTLGAAALPRLVRQPGAR